MRDDTRPGRVRQRQGVRRAWRSWPCLWKGLVRCGAREILLEKGHSCRRTLISHNTRSMLPTYQGAECVTSATPQSALMRLNESQIQSIRETVQRVAGPDAQVRVFGSRLSDDVPGGDVDLLVELPEAVAHPALLAARLSARISRSLDGRKVDVVLLAPNLDRLPIHEVALREGRLI